MAYISKKLAKAFEISEMYYKFADNDRRKYGHDSKEYHDSIVQWNGINAAFSQLFDFDSSYDFIDAQCEYMTGQKDTRYMERA